ncbi:hypothetical protein T492DRAFT_854345 [Pavlovales sp. CCMP2436]|nr:hypothetical protein T492DRAFT_854345 [Pavlovales sp. CCMP2436]
MTTTRDASTPPPPAKRLMMSAHGAGAHQAAASYAQAQAAVGSALAGGSALVGGGAHVAGGGGRKSTPFALVMTSAGILVFDASKFRDAKSCFIYQMTGAPCGLLSCPMVNGMSTTVQAERDRAHAACHSPTCSHCDIAGHVAGCHGTDDWLGAHPALATYPFH